MECDGTSLRIYHRFRKLIGDSAFHVAKDKLRYTYSGYSGMKEQNREHELGL